MTIRNCSSKGHLFALFFFFVISPVLRCSQWYLAHDGLRLMEKVFIKGHQNREIVKNYDIRSFFKMSPSISRHGVSHTAYCWVRLGSKAGFLVINVVTNVNGILNEVFLLLEQNPVSSSSASALYKVIFGGSSSVYWDSAWKVQHRPWYRAWTG